MEWRFENLVLLVASTSWALMSCGGAASDGDPTSDTSSSRDTSECPAPGTACGSTDTGISTDTGSGMPDTGSSTDTSGGESGDSGLVECSRDCSNLSKTIDPMDGSGPISFSEGTPDVVGEGPDGGDVYRFEGTSNGGFTGRVDAKFTAEIDLEERGIDLDEYDLLKLQVKADRAAFLSIGTDNYPDPGTEARWWVLDALRGPFGWRTIYVDLNLPETVERESRSDQKKLYLNGFVKDTGRSKQSDERRIWLGDLRAVRRAVAVDWDQKTFQQRRASNGDLVYEYPIRVENELSRAVTAEMSLNEVDVRAANGSLERNSIPLEAGESREITATLRLPSAEASSKPPLYTERFQLAAQAADVQDSRVTILRSADPIQLPITVPVDEQNREFPILPPPEKLPDAIVHFDASEARSKATAASPSDLIDEAAENGIYNYDQSRNVSAYRTALVGAAYLYRRTGEQKFLQIGKDLLEGLPRIWREQKAGYRQQPYRVVSSGIVVRWGERWHYTLGLGWRLMGTQRSPYQYSYDANSSAGSMSAMLYAFDILAPELSESARARIIDEFIVPAGIQSRNHYIGDGNQQATVDAVALYAGLVSENWPLVAFAHSSHHSFQDVLEWTFTEDGVHIRDGYQTYALRPIFWNLEVMHGVGIDLYSEHEDRLQTTVNEGFGDMYFWEWVRNNRL